MKNNIESKKEKRVSSLGNTICEVVIPEFSLKSLVNIEKSIQKNIVHFCGHHSYIL